MNGMHGKYQYDRKCREMHTQDAIPANVVVQEVRM